MQLLQLLTVTNRFCRCSCCQNLSPYTMRAFDRQDRSTGEFCMHCFRILSAVQLSSTFVRKGV